MARYIDADKIKSKLQKKSINSATTFINTVLIGLLDDEPTADVVEIVRCKDCKKRYTKNCSLCYDTANKGYFLWSMINDNFFCAYGERKCDND